MRRRWSFSGILNSKGFLFAIGLVLALILTSIGAFISGTVIWLLWPIAIPGVFPGLVEKGILVGKIGWFAATCFSWIIAVIVQGTKASASVKV